ncbi:acetylcholine receptor subunit alpha-L1-like [Ostrea edulis]|uniref:acetylcholine receptor subunit alpha-L1-like n=1 Tax=Ostrea edulis TaxID=37623 RepID=UPI0024AF3E81|nr:acetylcholine receptor subunit alpha-L1-like [Ostrea edulis]
MSRFYMYLFFLFFKHASGKKHSLQLYNDLFQNSSYNKVLIPTLNDNDILPMKISFLPRGISEFNEVTGRLSIAMGLDIRWTDEFLKWNPFKYGNVSHLVVPEDHVWTPVIILANPIDRTPVFPDDSFPIRVYANGQLIWIKGGTVSVTCQPNVKYYPFDEHKCSAIFLTIDRIGNELRMETGMRSVINEKYGEWDIHSMNAYSSRLDVYSCSVFEITVRRRSEFLILNTCIPILCLGILNACVFLIPPESGERVSFAMTVLLSFAVFMTIFSASLPKNSDPVPIVCYVLMIMMFESGIIVILTIIGLRIFFKREDESIPKFVSRIAKLTGLKPDKCRKSDQTLRNGRIQNDEESHKQEQASLTWERLRIIFDMTCFCVSFGIFVLLVCVYATMVKIS